jgi:hypothetical protein
MLIAAALAIAAVATLKTDCGWQRSTTGSSQVISTPFEAQSVAARKRVIDWFGGSLVSRLNERRSGAIVAVIQRLHEGDLAGHVVRQGGGSISICQRLLLEEQVFQLGPETSHHRRVGDVRIRNARALRRSKRSSASSAA